MSDALLYIVLANAAQHISDLQFRDTTLDALRGLALIENHSHVTLQNMKTLAEDEGSSPEVRLECAAIVMRDDPLLGFNLIKEQRELQEPISSHARRVVRACIERMVNHEPLNSSEISTLKEALQFFGKPHAGKWLVAYGGDPELLRKLRKLTSRLGNCSLNSEVDSALARFSHHESLT
ncbi:MAG: hypothetical protein DCC75_03785 [Proteobacteria bacterium]|nr:MAG: hypothetical protein DCC75_03785 [Pseudomonadota bacterium]